MKEILLPGIDIEKNRSRPPGIVIPGGLFLGEKGAKCLSADFKK